MSFDASAILRAGGLVRSSEQLARGESADVIDARVYTHPALGQRPVVRLVSGALAVAEDAALDFLGMRVAGVTEAIAYGRRQSLGFPAWALANDPANGAYALAVVKDMERFARLARTKPGAARDGFEQLADRLARTVPHFVPSFYEQVGRIYIDLEQANRAAGMFSRAREAERIYNLPSHDEERRREVFIEFALAGALSTRALDEYADQLAANRPPIEAYQTFRELCVQRTLGGLPPTAAMAERLTRLVRAAGLNIEAEARALIEELVEAPSMVRAAAGFWKPFGPALVGLAHQSAEFRGKLLNLFPAPVTGLSGFTDWWLELLATSGAADALTQPAGCVPPEAEPAGGPAAWLSRLVAQHNQSWRAEMPASLLALLERMADRLRADGVGVDLIGARSWRCDLDLIDAALALEVPLAPPPGRVPLHVVGPGARTLRRDLLHLVADPCFGPIVAGELDDDLSRGTRKADQLPSNPGVQRLLSDWLAARAEELESGGLPQVQSALARLENTASERTFALNPAARARIVQADLATALARTLRVGILDEFGWPALEEAFARLGSTRASRVQESWPNLILYANQRAVVVGPNAILLEHDLRVKPPDERGLGLFYTGGQLLAYWPEGAGLRGYWSGRPTQVFDVRRAAQTSTPTVVSIELPDGGRTRGGRALHPGDTSLPEAAQLFTDGTTFWRREPRADVREYDPVSGRAGRSSRPPLLDDPSLELASCSLLPAVAGLENSPLGSAYGLLGWAAGPDEDAPGVWHGRRIDAARFHGRLAGARRTQLQATRPLGLLTMPGDEETPRPFGAHHKFVVIWSPDGAFMSFWGGAEEPAELAAGSPIVPPPLFWHCLRPRDPDASRALRTLSDAAARTLLDAAVADLGAANAEMPLTRGILQDVLPSLTHVRLRDGIVGVCTVAARLDRRRANLKALHVEPVAPPGGTSTAVDDATLRATLGGLLIERIWHVTSAGQNETFHQIRVLAEIAEGGAMPATLPSAPMPWPQLLGHLGAVAYRAASPAISADERTALLGLLEVLAATPFVGRLDHVRLVDIVDGSALGRTGYPSRVLRQQEPGLLRKPGLRTWFFGPPQQTRMIAGTRGFSRLLLELSPDDRFRLPPECQLLDEHPIPRAWETPERIARFVSLVRERGPLVWRPESVERLAAATGLTRPEAALLLAGLPGVRTYTHQFLITRVRQMLGLGAADAAAARDALRGIHGDTLRDVLTAAMPDDPAQLWDADTFVERLAAAWNASIGRRVAVPEELVRQLGSSIKTSVPAAEVLAACASPDTDPRLNRDGAWEIGTGSMREATLVRRDDAAEPVFDGAMLLSVAMAYAWLFSTRPVGDPIRARLPDVLDHARQRLANRDLLVGPEWVSNFPTDPAFMQSVAESGALILRPVSPGPRPYGRAILRPAAALDSVSPTLVPLMGSLRPTYEAARFLLGPAAAAMAERVVQTPVPDGGYEANPAVGVPDLVARVAAALGLDPDPATAYLQLLTLAEPTSRNLARWNGWQARRLGAAMDALVDRGLLVRGTRARAGREVFLPGPWEDLKAPSLPIETWKLPLYEDAPLGGRVLPMRPLHELFAAAWQRHESGDVPSFAPVPASAGGA